MEVYAKTDIGKSREMNQDYYYVSDEKDEIKLYILADGMGGYNGGEIASKLAVESVKNYINHNYHSIEYDKDGILNLMKEAIEYANMMVYEKSKEDETLNEMGTTLDVLLIYKEKLYIGHVGDSRIYGIRKNNIRRITVDHSYVEKLIKDGSITREEAKTHPKRNMLIKAIGSNTFVVPDLMEKVFLKDDTILMCSDGLNNMLSEEEIMKIVKEEGKDVAEKLVEKANEAGGTDNITVIVLKNK